MSDLPFSQACENNKQYILEVIQRHLDGGDRVLEIGSGTGQHGAYFTLAMPGVHWQCTDIAENLPTLRPRIDAAQLANLPAPFSLNVDQPRWHESGTSGFDAVFSANSLHIMGAGSVENFFKGIAVNNTGTRLLMVYGPFKYRGEFTTESNARFDLWLKERDPASGIRDFEWIDELASNAGFNLLEDNAMPANNQLLVWSR